MANLRNNSMMCMMDMAMAMPMFRVVPTSECCFSRFGRRPAL